MTTRNISGKRRFRRKVCPLNRQLLISYAQAFVSFLFRTPGMKSGDIKFIYLFGSVARGDFDEDSGFSKYFLVEMHYIIPAEKINKVTRIFSRERALFQKI